MSYIKNITVYFSRLRECGVGPFGQLTKLSLILRALKMLVGQVSEEDAKSDATRKFLARATVVETKINSLLKALKNMYTKAQHVPRKSRTR